MTSYTSIGQARFNVVHLPSEERLTTTIIFEERKQDIYYCWTIKDKVGNEIASKCLPISKRIISGNRLDFCISHALESINTYRIGRQKVFQVEGAEAQET
jgi:hypothetical protein